MSTIEFYKVSSKGKLDPIQADPKSLHFKRALIIKDSINQIIWLINGSGVSANTKQSSQKVAKKINSQHGFQFKIRSPNPKDNEKIVKDILDNHKSHIDKKPKLAKLKTKKTNNQRVREVLSRKSIPTVPNLPTSISISPKLKGDVAHEGPQIEEFQIAYYDEDGGRIGEDKIFQISIRFLNEIKKIIDDNYPQKKGEALLNTIVKDIINIIYQK